MSILPMCIEIERPSPVFASYLNHRDLLSGLVLPAILAAQRSGWKDLQNKNDASQEKDKASKIHDVRHQNQVHVEEKLTQKPNNENKVTLPSSTPSDISNLSASDKFEVALDVRHFSPEELLVKTAEGYIVVEGKHEEKQDEHGLISRQFVRRYALPEDCHPDTVESKLSSDGVLIVKATKKRHVSVVERAVPIEYTESTRNTPSTIREQQKDNQQ